MMEDVSISAKNTNESVSENNSNNRLDKSKIYTEILTVVIELKDRKKAAYKEDICNYLCKEKGILLSESDFNDYVTDLVANGKIIIRKYAGKETLSLPNEKNTSPTDVSKNSIGSDKLTAQLHEDITGIKTEFVSLRNVMITEIRDIKNLKKNCEVEVNDSLFDVNERLIRYQSEEIKFLPDEINNKNLIIKTLLKNLND